MATSCICNTVTSSSTQYCDFQMHTAKRLHQLIALLETILPLVVLIAHIAHSRVVLAQCHLDDRLVHMKQHSLQI